MTSILGRPTRRSPVGLLLAAILIGASPVYGQSGAVGTIEGRVINATSGQYLNQSRIAVDGSTLQTLTDEVGRYVLRNVPAGNVALTVFYTGLEPQNARVSVAPGQTVVQDFSLSRGGTAASGAAVRMDEFLVAETRELNAQAISINEQRFSRNIKSVVTAEEHGDIGESNIGELAKFIPGVSVNYSGGIIATNMTLRGLPPHTTTVTMNGGAIAGPGSAGTNRDFDLSAFQAANSVSRVEVLKSPTPDVPASMLGGTINIISKSAFERARRQFTYRGYLTGTTLATDGHWASPESMEARIRPIQPGFDFSYIAPISKTFGFTLSGAGNARYLLVNNSESTWDIVNNILPTHELNASTQYRTAGSGAVTLDWKLKNDNFLSVTLTNADSHAFADTYLTVSSMGAAPTGGPTFTQSTGTRGSIEQASQTFDRHDQTWQTGVHFRHTGPVWRFESRGSYSGSTNKFRYVDKQAFSRVSATVSALSLRFDEIGGRGNPGPGTISATNAAGTSVNIHDVTEFNLNSATDGRRSAFSERFGGQLSATRRFSFRVPLDLKAGVQFDRETRDTGVTPRSWTFLGRDGIAGNADNRVGLYDFIADKYSSQERPYGFPNGKFLSPYKIFEYFKANPQQFLLNDVAAITGKATGTSLITETISAGYLRGDLSLFDNRLHIVAGARYERTVDDGDGVLNDLRGTLQQDASGNLLRDALGRTIPITTNAIERALLQFKVNGAHAKRTYDDIYPSLNASFDLTPNLIARFAYAKTIGRPQFGVIIPGITVSDPSVAAPTIRVNNTGLQPWTADALDFTLEHYFKSNGVVSVGVFRKEIKNFFGAVTRPATVELLEEYGLTDDYLNYSVITNLNIGDATVTGFEAEYRQALHFLPQWARGFQVFANGTFLDLESTSNLADFSNFVERTVTWGGSYSRSRFSIKLNWAYSSDIRGAFLAPSATVPADAYIWTPARKTLDLSCSFRVYKNVSLYGTARNLTNSKVYQERRGPSTPDYAKNRRYLDIGSFVSVGVKGEF